MGRKRRARGTGSIWYDEGRRCWVGRVPVGKLAGGRTRYAEVSAATQAECARKMRDCRPLTDAATVGAWADRWFAQLRQQPSTISRYEAALRLHVRPRLGHVRAAAVTPGRVEAFAADLRAAGLSAGTVLGVLSALRGVLGLAARDGAIPANPVSGAKLPRKRRARVDTFAPDVAARVIAAATDRPAARAFALMAATGCRIGEAGALDVSDWDGERVAITKTYTEEHGTRRPKSEAGTRTIRVPAQARAALDAAKGDRTGGPLFATARGTRPSAVTLRAAWRTLLKHLGEPYRKPHVLRHSFITHALAAGEPIADVARYVGDTPQTLMAVYCHPTGRDVSLAFERLLGEG